MACFYGEGHDCRLQEYLGQIFLQSENHSNIKCYVSELYLVEMCPGYNKFCVIIIN